MLRSGGRTASRVRADVDRHVGRSYRVAASTALGVLVLAVLGAVMGPQWDPVPLADPLDVETSSTAIGSAAPVQQYDVRTSVVSVQLDGVTVDRARDERIARQAGALREDERAAGQRKRDTHP